MFRIFPFKFGGMINLDALGGIVEQFLDNIDVSSLSDEYQDEYQDEDKTYEEETKFICLEEDEDMYVLSIELNGVDLRQTSIQYNPGKISVNLNKIEAKTVGNGMFPSNSMIKNNYKKEFDKIEPIEETKIIKIIENGVLKISMPKKYILNEKSKIIDVDNYIEN